MAKGTLQIEYEKLVLENLDLKERIKELEQKNKELMNLLGEWEIYLEEHKKVIDRQNKRIAELEKALQGMVPFIEDDFPNGTGEKHGTCATDKYQQACDAVINILKG